MANRRRKVLVGLSGGVDSAYSAYLLKKQGYDVEAVYMWCYGSGDSECASHKDRKDAVKVASYLDMPIRIWDFEKEYSSLVLDRFYEEYAKGRTPNPDIVCNEKIKYGLFYRRALEEGYDYVATGHYARVLREGETYFLASGKDEKKDQSYFLYRLRSDMLEHIMYPLGNLLKADVRAGAKKAGIPVWDRKDSQGICFVGKVSLRDFLKEKVKHKKGPVMNTSYEVVGYHYGLPFYTVGQRRGFVLTKYQPIPLYVIKKDMKRNALIVGFGKDTLVDEFRIDNLTWVNGIEGALGGLKSKELKVRIRHLGEKIPCKVRFESDDIILCVLKSPYEGVAPGQSAVFYLRDVVLGGGIIL